MKITATALLAILASCHHQDAATGTSLAVSNEKTETATVYVSFGSDSEVTADDWEFCSGSGLNCSFDLGGKKTRPIPNPEGKYINATFSFNHQVGCGATKGEVNINNPSWYDTLDVSLVDGYNNKIRIDAKPKDAAVLELGPPKGKDGNADVYGVFPYGCDVCVARESPPCGISKGKDGCKAGTQYDPKPPCQWQGTMMGGGDLEVSVVLMPARYQHDADLAKLSTPRG